MLMVSTGKLSEKSLKELEEKLKMPVDEAIKNMRRIQKSGPRLKAKDKPFEPTQVSDKPNQIAQQALNKKISALSSKAEEVYSEWLKTRSPLLLTKIENDLQSVVILLTSQKQKVDASIFFRLGEAQQHLGHIGSAEESYKKVLGTGDGPFKTRALLNLVEVLTRNSKFKEALEMTETAYPTLGGAQKLFLLSNKTSILFGLKRVDEAVSVAREAAFGLGELFGYSNPLSKTALKNLVFMHHQNEVLKTRLDNLSQLRKEWTAKVQEDGKEDVAKGEASSSQSHADFEAIYEKQSQVPFKEFSPSGYFLTEGIVKKQLENFQKDYPQYKYNITTSVVDSPTLGEGELFEQEPRVSGRVNQLKAFAEEDSARLAAESFEFDEQDQLVMTEEEQLSLIDETERALQAARLEQQEMDRFTSEGVFDKKAYYAYKGWAWRHKETTMTEEDEEDYEY